MNTDATDEELLETLRLAQRLGVLGPVGVDDVVAHGRWYVSALAETRGRVVDLGSGAGVPGLVIARARTDLRVTLVDRRSKRTDLLERAVRRLGLDDRVEVRCEDVTRTIERDAAGFDAVTARLFGPAAWALEVGARLRAPGGIVVISEPPDGDRWDPAVVAGHGVRRHRHGPLSVFSEETDG
ncbi:MAG: RsmG family class I SAM-dependent methyltransferase [Ilumatobacteraceae bacterium]